MISHSFQHIAHISCKDGHFWRGGESAYHFLGHCRYLNYFFKFQFRRQQIVCFYLRFRYKTHCSFIIHMGAVNWLTKSGYRAVWNLGIFAACINRHHWNKYGPQIWASQNVAYGKYSPYLSIARVKIHHRSHFAIALTH